MNSHDNWDPAAEEMLGVIIGKALEPSMEELKAKLPAGTHFGIIVEVPAPEGQLGRAVVMSTDRRRIGLLAAQWIVNAEPFSA